MNEKVIVLQNKEDRESVVQQIRDAGIKIRSILGTFIIILEPTSSQTEVLAAKGVVVRTTESAMSDLSQLSEEDRLLSGAYMLRKTPAYIARKANYIPGESIEEKSMFESGCEHDINH